MPDISTVEWDKSSLFRSFVPFTDSTDCKMVGLDVQTVTVSGIAPKNSGMANVQRHPTIPMTKRDSLVISGSRVSLISNGSTTNPPTIEDKKQPNSHPEMVAGKRRSPKKVKRTDSYKKALNRQSQYDNVDGAETTVVVTAEVAKRRADEKQKYNTLPINTAQPTCNESNSRQKRHSASKSNGNGVGGFQRNASQKSGTYPSPDTDEDQRSIQPERKKKSAFKRFKERFRSSVRRDKQNQTERKDKKSGKFPPSGRIRPDSTNSTMGFHTPNGASVNGHGLQTGHPSHGRHSVGTMGSQGTTVDNYNSKTKGGTNIITKIRRSFRRKQSTDHLRPGKASSDDRPSSNELHPSPKWSHSSTSHGRISDSAGSFSSRPKNSEEEQILEQEDIITAVFGNIIDPPKSTYARGPDRSKLRLEGLRKFRPGSFDRGGGRRQFGYQQSDLSPTVEIDGLDYADGPTHSAQASSHKPEEEDLSFFDVQPDEQQRRIDDVAKRLAAIGDKIAADKQRASADSSSEIEGHRVGGHLSGFERDLLRDLHHYADREFGTNETSISLNLMPVIKSILAAQDYSNFKTVIQQELSHTNGWEQVAWYTCVIKATVGIAETGVGSVVKDRAKKFFSSFFKPWIESRPNGWESIYEETDVDSELD